MRLRTLAAALPLVACGTPPPADRAPPVIGWVAPYAMEPTMRALVATPAAASGLTRIGLQFWNPGADGTSVVLAAVDPTGKPVTPDDVKRFRDWARQRGIAVLLTVYNNSSVTRTWDWTLARNAFVLHRDAFVRALVDEMDNYQLDGIDIDLEGEGDMDADRAAYAAFVRGLSAALRPRGKLLTVDSFHSPCHNAPHMGWWSDWTGAVDAVHSMGYADLYEGSTESFTPPGKPVCESGAALFKYSWQLDWARRAGYRADQVVMGLPTWVDTWGSGGLGTDAVSHLREVRALGAGVGLWDLQLQGPGWRTPAAWDAVRALRSQRCR
jgi:hypothetical protein